MGSAGILGSVDIMLSCKYDGGRRTVETSGQRDGEPLEVTVVKLGPTGWVEIVGTKVAVQRATIEGRVWEWIQTRPESARKDIVKGVEGRQESILKAINAMVGSGELKRIGKGMKGDPFLYSMGRPPCN